MKKTSKQSMPKSINSKNTNNKCNIKILKGFNGQVLVSLEEYKAHRPLFLGKPGNNLRLKDGREVILVKVIGNMAFDLERVAELLLSFIFNVAGGVNSTNDPRVLLDISRAFKVYCSIMSFLDPSHMQDTLENIRRYDEGLYTLLSDKEVERLVAFSRSEFEDPWSHKVQLGDESIDVDYFLHLIEWGYKPLCCGLDDEFDSKEEYLDFVFTIITGCIMVAQLRGMERRAAINHTAKELGPGSKSFVEVMFRMLTIDKEAV